MLRKTKCYYSEEEIIDGFSILCFDNYKNLEKYSNSLNLGVRGKLRNNMSSYHEMARNTIVANSKKRNNVKKFRSDSKPLLKPTRVTAKRKSKPDISILSLSVGKHKKLKCIPSYKLKSRSVCFNENQGHPPVIDLERDISETVDEVLKSLECKSESIVTDKCDDDVNFSFEELTENSGKCGNHISEDCSNNSHKDFSAVGESSITAPSTASPESIGQMHFRSEFIDADSPDKVDIDQEDISKPIPSPIKIDLETKLIDNITISDDEEDCVILSVGFDPDPKMCNIPISIVQSAAPDVPKLKPAPTQLYRSSLRTIFVQSKFGNSIPPPLTPAPDPYFFAPSRDQDSWKPKSLCRTMENGSKYRARKRVQTKSAVSKLSPKCLRLSQSNLSTESIVKSQFTANFLNGKYCCASIDSILPLTTRPTFPHATVAIASKGSLPDAINYNQKLLKPIPIYSTKIKPPMKSVNGSSQYLIRKTICHVHIAQSIHKRLNSDSIPPNLLTSNLDLARPRPLRPISQTLSPLNLTQKSNASITESYPNQKSLNQCNFPSKSIQSYNSMKSVRDLPVLIRPLNKSYLVGNSYNSRRQNPINIFPRENIVLLK